MKKARIICSDTTYISEEFDRKNYYYSDRLAIGILDAGCRSSCPDAGRNEALIKFSSVSSWLIQASSMHSQNPPYMVLDYVAGPQPREKYLESEFIQQVFNVAGGGEELFSPAVDTTAAEEVRGPTATGLLL